MAARLSSTYRAFALRRRQLGLSQVFWFTWASEYDTNSSTNTQPFRYAGLVKRAGTRLHADARADDVQHGGGPLRGLPQVGRHRLALPLSGAALALRRRPLARPRA